MSSGYTIEEPRQQCPTCRASYPYGIARCAFCGSALPFPPAEPAEAPVEAPEPEPVEVFVPPQAQEQAHCAWCGFPRPEGAQQCPTCGAPFAADEQSEAYARAALELRLQAARVDAAAEEAGDRTAKRWRWASWALARAILRWPGNL